MVLIYKYKLVSMNNFDICVISIFMISIILIILLKLKSFINSRIDYNKLFDINVNNDKCKNTINNVQLINNKNNSIEKFIVSDAHDFSNYNKHREKVIEKEDNYCKDKIDNPDNSDIVDYDNSENNKLQDFTMQLTYKDHDLNTVRNNKVDKLNVKNHTEKDRKLYVTSADFGLEAPRQFVSCANSSIAQKWRSGKYSLLPSQISCNKPNKIQAEDYYKTFYKAQIIPLEDHLVRGHNYMNYSNYVAPWKVDFRILSQTTKGLNPKDDKYRTLPTGFGYAFHNTPAMRMP